MEKMIGMNKDLNFQLENKIQKNKIKINQLIESNKLKKCLKRYMEMIDLIKDNEEKSIKQIYGETLKSIGQLLYKKMTKHGEAIPYLLESLKIYNTLSSESEFIYELYLDLYYCHLKLGNSNSLIFYGQLAVVHIHLDSKTKCKIYSSIGRFYLLTYLETFKTSNLIKGISSSTDAIELYKALNYEPVNDYIDCLYDCGELCFYINDYDLSLKYYEDILNFSSSLTISSNILFGVYSNLSHIYHVKGYKETEQYYNKKLLEIESKY